MHQELTTHQAASILAEDYSSSFSYAGAYALCQHLELIEAQTDTDIPFDPVAIRCDWTEYPSATVAAGDILCQQDFAAVIEDGDGGEYLTEEDKEEAYLENFREDGAEIVEVPGGGVILGPC